ncbi:MAG TPA: DUF1697 domain-containing protein [Hyphomicrobiales bacterium]|nr:DUF1697 domain-containing protein [Hyphomicrobiales bacterium]
MTKYVALLRAVNVAGAGKLPMAHLKSICLAAGFTGVETYIASGNAIFESDAPASEIKAKLETRLIAYAGKPVGVIVRTAAQMQAVLCRNPFPEAEPKHTYVIFLDEPAPADALLHAKGRDGERMHLSGWEIFVHYPMGMGRSKLKIPAAKWGTARNMNTVTKLAEIASK